jgi:hypothetical protein
MNKGFKCISPGKKRKEKKKDISGKTGNLNRVCSSYTGNIESHHYQCLFLSFDKCPWWACGNFLY